MNDTKVSTQTRIARFFLVNITQTGKMNQMVLKYPTYLLNIPNGRKIYQHFPIKGSPKFTQIFGLKVAIWQP
jgi:hypothetical protein